MIDKEKVQACLAVLDQLPEEEVDLSISSSGRISLRIYPKNWWHTGVQWSDEKRHEVLAMVTPLVGRLDKKVDGTHIGYTGEKDNLTVYMNYVDQCKILGYKTVKRTVTKEVEREPEYETTEVEEQVPITDCDIRLGKFREDQIDVPA